jgi:kumamolisin
MAANEGRIQIAGSARTIVSGAREIGAVNPDERVAVTLRLRPAGGGPVAATPDLSSHPTRPGRFATRSEVRLTRGMARGDVEIVRAFANDHGLTVGEVALAERKVVLEGSAAAFAGAFGVTLRRYQVGDRTYRGRTGTVTVPASIASVVEGVFGLDDRQQAQPHFQVLGTAGAPAAPGIAAAAAAAPMAAATVTPPELSAAYDFPSDADGTGQCIAIIELGGGFRRTDLKTYFAGLGIPAPRVTAVSVDGGRNQPSTADTADGEVMLDIEVAAAIAPKAQIAVYFAPNTDRGFLDAITKAIHDNRRRPSIVSISWGAAESGWTGQAMQAMDQAFADAALLGVTVLVAAGDDGSNDRVSDGLAHADFPASSPHVVACGGTRVTIAGGAITKEVVWNDGPGSATGGGVSDVFPLPAYQGTSNVPHSANPGHRVGRGVPDIAGDASPASGYAVRVDGQDLIIGGTSAVAPLYAGLVALLNQKLGSPVGFLNPLLYGVTASGVYEDITSGANGAYPAGIGWDACTGLGRVDGTGLYDALKGP